jgi:hypothetical protein
VLRDRGDNVGARRVLIAMENHRRKYGNLKFWTLMWQWILRGTIGYGYRPWYTLFWVIGIVTLGAMLFRYGYRIGAVTPSDKDAFGVFETYNPKQGPHGDPPRYYEKFSAPVYSLDAFLPIINFDQKEHWRPNAQQGRYGEILRIFLWIHIGLGWHSWSLR